MFSVVIPLYNKEISIKSTIESVLNQTFDNFELIVVDDGSTDSSPDLVAAIKDDRIKLIHQDNQGVSAARNRGIKESQYDWVTFLDADDLWERNHLAEIVKMMDVFPNEKLYVTSFEYSDGRQKYKHPRDSDIFKIDNYFKEVLKEHLICTDVIAIYKECFDNVGMFNENLNRGEDLDLWARLGKEYKIIKSKEVTAIYRVETENKLTRKKSEFDKSLLSVINFKGLRGYERLYYKKMVLRRLKLDLRQLDFKEFWRIIVLYNFELIK